MAGTFRIAGIDSQAVAGTALELGGEATHISTWLTRTDRTISNARFLTDRFFPFPHVQNPRYIYVESKFLNDEM